MIDDTDGYLPSDLMFILDRRYAASMVEFKLSIILEFKLEYDNGCIS